MTNKDELLFLFDELHELNIEYVVLRDLDRVLPDKITADKDIDLLVRDKDKERYRDLLKKCGYRKIRHPWDFGNNFVFLYAATPFDFYIKGDIRLDISYQMCCRSINAGEWMPVDNIIQQSVWETRSIRTGEKWYRLSREDELIHLLTRCIFDKKEFSDKYINRIEELMPKVNIHDVENKLLKVVFNFTQLLLNMIKKSEYAEINKSYLTFMAY